VWLYQIAHTRAVTFVRGERRQAQALDEVRGSPQVEQVDEDPSIDNADLVHRALQALSLEHREVLTLHFLEDMALEEIAEVLRCPLGTVKSRMHYGKQALRHEVERLDHG
jgi:RNA polymerase sigma-70 factor (ECF subfamily)